MHSSIQKVRVLVVWCGLVGFFALSSGCDALNDLLKQSPQDQQKVADCFQTCTSACEAKGNLPEDCLVSCADKIQGCLAEVQGSDGESTAAEGTAAACDDKLGACMTACVKQGAGDTCFMDCKVVYEKCLGPTQPAPPAQDCLAFETQCQSFCTDQDPACLGKCDELSTQCYQNQDSTTAPGIYIPPQPCDLMKLHCLKGCTWLDDPTTCGFDCEAKYQTCLEQPSITDPNNPCPGQLDECLAACPIDSTSPGTITNDPPECQSNCKLWYEDCMAEQPQPEPMPSDACSLASEKCALECADESCFAQCELSYQECINQTSVLPADPCLAEMEFCLSDCDATNADETCFIGCKQQVDFCHSAQLPPPPEVGLCQQSLDTCVAVCPVNADGTLELTCLDDCEQTFLGCVSG